MTALAVVQARLSSRRLPGKVLADVEGEPLLGFMLKRLRGSRLIERVVVATSVESEDVAVAEVAAAHGAGVVRGPLDDVLARFVQAVGEWRGPVVRLTADCPLVDPELVDEVIGAFAGTPSCAYASNIEPRSYPDGLDVECVAAQALAEINAESTEPADREHVTLAVRRDGARFPQASVMGERDLSALRWTVDLSEDLAFVRAIVARLGARRHSAGMAEVLAAVHREPPLSDAFGGSRG